MGLGIGSNSNSNSNLGGEKDEGLDSREEGGVGGIKVPLRAVERVPRTGLGLPGAEKWKIGGVGGRETVRRRGEAHALEVERRRREIIREKFGKGETGMEKLERMERKQRKEMLAYMNR